FGLSQDRALLDAAAAAEAARPAGVGADLVTRRQHRTQSFLRLERLHREPDAEDRSRRIRSVLAVAAAPAADHPVVPHEDRPALVASVPAADEQVLEVERARERTLWLEL